MTILKVNEMSCNHCVERISKALDAVSIPYEVDLEKKTVSVDGDQNIINQAIEELDDLGFHAEPM